MTQEVTKMKSYKLKLLSTHKSHKKFSDNRGNVWRLERGKNARLYNEDSLPAMSMNGLVAMGFTFFGSIK